MTIKSVVVNIVNGSGGLNNNAIPIYADNKAPNGSQVLGANGKQLMLENSAVSGVQYITVNPFMLTDAENNGNQFVSWKESGNPNYIRLWIRNPDTGLGEDYKPGIQMWAEYSHLLSVDVPEPPAGDESTFVINWANKTITLKPS